MFTFKDKNLILLQKYKNFFLSLVTQFKKIHPMKFLFLPEGGPRVHIIFISHLDEAKLRENQSLPTCSSLVGMLEMNWHFCKQLLTSSLISFYSVFLTDFSWIVTRVCINKNFDPAVLGSLFWLVSSQAAMLLRRILLFMEKSCVRLKSSGDLRCLTC